MATMDYSLYSKKLPSNAGYRSGGFLAEQSLYNATPSNMRGFLRGLAKARAGNLVTFSFIGDSKVAGIGTNNGVSIIGAQSMPGHFRSYLSSKGYPIAGTGPVFPYCNAAFGTVDNRYVFAGTWSAEQGAGNANFRSATAAGSTATFTSDLAGTVVEIYSLSNSAPFTYSIDGGGAVTVTPTGSSVIYKTTITGLSNAVHTVVITSTTATATYLLAINVRQTTGLQIANHGISGSSSIHWVNAQSPLFYQCKLVSENIIPTIDGVFISLGTNDSGNSVGKDVFKANITETVNAHKALGRSVMYIVPTQPAVAHAAYANWTLYVSAMYDLADSLDIPLIDFNEVQGTQESASAAGLFYDVVHETSSGYAMNALALSKVF